MPKIPVYQPGEQGGELRLGGGLSYAPGNAISPTEPTEKLANALAGALQQYAQVQAKVRAEDQRLDLATQIERMKNDFGEREAQMRAAQLDPSTAVRPDQYPDLVNQELQNQVQTGLSRLKYRENGATFMIHSMPFVREQMAVARNRALHIGMIQAEGAAEIQDRKAIQQIVFGSKTEQEDGWTALKRNDLMRTGFGQPTKMPAHLAEIDEATARRDWQNPNLRLEVSENLSKGKYLNMPADKQLVLNHTLMNEDRVEKEHALALLEKQMTQAKT